MKHLLYLIFPVFLSGIFNLHGQPTPVKLAESTAGFGWSGNSVNTVIFRKNALTSFRDTQFIAYYNQDGYVMLGKKCIRDTSWLIRHTVLKGNVNDAHRSISIMADGEGYLHIAFDHHTSRLRYCRTIAPYSLEPGPEIPMTANRETSVTYPEFYRFPDGNLIFLYRDGRSGSGNLVINRYDLHKKQWIRVHDNLIDGEIKRNAYWQACTDNKGNLHLSWVWRESPDVASNHDICYAFSSDGGYTWKKSSGDIYSLPITETTAEVAAAIPANSELINQTSMAADAEGSPVISTYWRGINGVPQYKLIYLKAQKWKVSDLGFRKSDFSLSGAGTKKIPVSRPQVVLWKKAGKNYAGLLFRDNERNNLVSMAIGKPGNKRSWRVTDLSKINVGEWEPLFDAALWDRHGWLDIFVQPVVQADHEGVVNALPTAIKVIRYRLY